MTHCENILSLTLEKKASLNTERSLLTFGKFLLLPFAFLLYIPTPIPPPGIPPIPISAPFSSGASAIIASHKGRDYLARKKSKG
jgi:hypothetical protein